MCNDIEDIDIENFCILNKIDTISCLGLIYLLENPVLFLNKIAKINSVDTFIVETVYYNELQNNIKIDDHTIKLNNIDDIKNIFINNNWKIKYESHMIINELNQKVSSDLIFGNRVVLIFGKN